MKIEKFDEFNEGLKNPFAKKPKSPDLSNPIDPYGEEDWNEEYDIIIEKPGFLAKHRKGGEVGSWNWNINIPNYWKYVNGVNPDFDENKKDFYCGLVAGYTMADEYHEKIKTGHDKKL